MCKCRTRTSELSEDTVRQLSVVKSLSFLENCIANLESKCLSTEDQISILMNVIDKLSKHDFYSERMKEIFARNPDVNLFIDFKYIDATEIDKYYVYVPLSTVAVKRSFSKQKDLLSDKRKSFTPK